MSDQKKMSQTDVLRELGWSNELIKAFEDASQVTEISEPSSLVDAVLNTVDMRDVDLKLSIPSILSGTAVPMLSES